MLPKERRDRGQNDLFKLRLDQIVDLNHALAKLARRSTGDFLRANSGRSTPMFPAGRRCRRG
jgi:IS5 family transposase